VDFIISHLEGLAKEELRYRTASDKKTPGAVLKILTENFCNFLSLGAKMTFGSTGALPLAITVASLFFTSSTFFCMLLTHRII
jgi:hypothetical protein